MQDNLGVHEECEEDRCAERVRSGPGQKDAPSPVVELAQIAERQEPDGDHNQERKRIYQENGKHSFHSNSVVVCPWSAIRTFRPGFHETSGLQVIRPELRID